MSTITEVVSLVLPAAPETDDNATLVKHWHEVATQFAAGALEAAARAGDVLLEQKQFCQQRHIRFKDWIAHHCPFSHKTATTYIRIAENWDRLEEVKRASPGEPVSIREAMRLIDDPKPEPPVEVVDMKSTAIADLDDDEQVEAMEAGEPAIDAEPAPQVTAQGDVLPPDDARRRGVMHGNEAINSLKKIRPNDELRVDGFQVAARFIRHYCPEALSPAEVFGAVAGDVEGPLSAAVASQITRMIERAKTMTKRQKAGMQRLRLPQDRGKLTKCLPSEMKSALMTILDLCLEAVRVAVPIEVKASEAVRAGE